MNNTAVREKKEFKVPGLPAYYIALAVDIILLYLMNNVKYISISFINQDLFASCLWVINLALGAGIMGNFFLLLYRPKWYYHFTQMVLNFLVAFGLYTIYSVFPFNFDQDILKTIVKIVLILITAGIGLSAIYEMVRFIIDFISRERRQPAPAESVIASEAVPQTDGTPNLEAPQASEVSCNADAAQTQPQIRPEQPEDASSNIESSQPVAPPEGNTSGSTENISSDASTSKPEPNSEEKPANNTPTT